MIVDEWANNPLLGRLAHWAAIQPQKAALIADEKVYTYRQLYEKIREQAAVYLARNKESAWPNKEAPEIVKVVREQEPFLRLIDGQRDIVLIYAEDFLSQVVQWLGALAAGLIPIACHYDLPHERRQALREDLLQQPVSLETSWGAGIFGVLSSGTTGVPKILWRTVKSWYGFFPIQHRVFKFDRDSSLFLHGSFSFTGNSNVCIASLCEGATVVTSSKMQPARWAQLCKVYAVSHIYLLPTKLRLWSRLCHQECLPQVVCVFTGSQCLDEFLVARLEAMMPHMELILYYGASELSYITWCTAAEWRKKPSTVGRPFEGVRVEVKANLIYVNTAYTVLGVTLPYTVEDKGWLDGEGFLHFEGRKHSFINRGGFKISITSLEQTIGSLPEVEEVVVLGVPDDLRGEQIACFVVLQNGGTIERLRDALRKILMSEEMPKYIISVKEIPLNACSKVNQAMLLEELLN